MDYSNLVMTLLILVGVGYIYDKLKLREEQDKNIVDYDLVRKYLLNDNSLAENKKPILWIHIPYEVNSREWCSFMSRNTNNLNQSYLYLTVKSIIDKCGEDFFVCIIDDDTFKKLLPNWNVDLNKLTNPLKANFRKLALANVLFNYGGILVPNSFICCQNLMPLYEKNIETNSMFVGEFVDRSIVTSVSDFSPNTRLMGCAQKSVVMGEYIGFLERLNSGDYTTEPKFAGTDSEWCKCKIQNNKINLIPAGILGVKDINNKPIGVEQLLSNNFLELQAGAIGVYIPSEELLKRTSFSWFVYLTPQDVLESDTQIGKRLLICND
jgi:hypothetical protein